MAEDSEQDDRTEEPTQRRLDDAIKKGQVASSPEINTFFILAAFTVVLLTSSGMVARGLVSDMRGFLANAHMVPQDGAGLAMAGRSALTSALVALAVPVGVVMLAGLAGGLLQHTPIWTFEPVMPQWSRVSPLAGLKRVFGIEAAAQLGKGIAKIGVVGAAAFTVLWGERDRLDTLTRLDPASILDATLHLSVRLMGAALAAHLVIAVVDAAYQRYRWRQRLRMTKEEVKQEHKEQEGSPEIKGRIRQLRMSRLKKRMMASVPKATVILANPTHYAVALRYEAGMAAPVCVAKGVDALALRIRSVAAEHGVPVIENPPLARALHATVQIDAEIPAEHYRAVAEVIGYVMRLRRRAA